MAKLYGIDFGTTNSLVSDVTQGKVRSFLDSNRPHPSVVWYGEEDPVTGKNAKGMLKDKSLGVVGDAVRSPKTEVDPISWTVIGESYSIFARGHAA